MLVIPAIDLKEGRCVGLLRGEFDAVTYYDDDPAELAQNYLRSGFSMLHVVDLDGALAGSPQNHEMIERIAGSADLKVQVGGGIRNRVAAERMLNAGVSRVVAGSLAIANPSELMRWLRDFGPERVVLALDVRSNDWGQPMVTTEGWRSDSKLTLAEALDLYRDTGLRHVLCTDVARDGAMSGPNTKLYRRMVEEFPELRWQASGGVRNVADLDELARIGVAAAISGKAFFEGRIRAEELTSYLPTV